MKSNEKQNKNYEKQIKAWKARLLKGSLYFLSAAYGLRTDDTQIHVKSYEKKDNIWKPMKSNPNWCSKLCKHKHKHDKQGF